MNKHCVIIICLEFFTFDFGNCVVCSEILALKDGCRSKGGGLKEVISLIKPQNYKGNTVTEGNWAQYLMHEMTYIKQL